MGTRTWRKKEIPLDKKKNYYFGTVKKKTGCGGVSTDKEGEPSPTKSKNKQVGYFGCSRTGRGFEKEGVPGGQGGRKWGKLKTFSKRTGVGVGRQRRSERGRQEGNGGGSRN